MNKNDDHGLISIDFEYIFPISLEATPNIINNLHLF